MPSRLRISRCVFLNSQPGGSALNTSKILSMLGEMNVVFCGMIGADSNGELIQKKLANCHLNVWWVKWPSPTEQMRWHSNYISIYRKLKFSAGVRLLMHSWKNCTRSQPFGGWWVGSLVALDTCAACTQYINNEWEMISLLDSLTRSFFFEFCIFLCFSVQLYCVVRSVSFSHDFMPFAHNRLKKRGIFT